MQAATSGMPTSGGGPRPAGRGGRAQSGAGRPRQHRQRRPELRGDKRPGADIAITAGAGSAGPDYDALGKRYLDPAIAPWLARLTSQPGKVVHTYERELADWLRARDGFTPAATRTCWRASRPCRWPLRQAFLRSVYFAELRAGGREYNDARRRPGSYLRGRQAIAAFPGRRGARGRYLDVRTVRRVRVGGGSIRPLAPGGQIVVGVQARRAAARA